MIPLLVVAGKINLHKVWNVWEMERRRSKSRQPAGPWTCGAEPWKQFRGAIKVWDSGGLFLFLVHT